MSAYILLFEYVYVFFVDLHVFLYVSIGVFLKMSIYVYVYFSACIYVCMFGWNPVYGCIFLGVLHCVLRIYERLPMYI